MSLRRKAAPAGKPLHRCAPIFAALGDEMRLRLIAALCVGGAMSITQLTSGTDITRQAITKHLDVLAAAGLLRGVKMGGEGPWGVEAPQMEEGGRPLGGDAGERGHARGEREP